MTEREEYISALEGLAPNEVAGYLTGAGWREVERGPRSAIWEFFREEEDLQSELLVPRDREVRDFVLRMDEMLRILSETEGRPEASILLDLTSRTADSQYFHTHPKTPTGTIPVPDGILALEGIRELMIAGAYSVTNAPMLVLPRRKSRQVEEFPNQVRLVPSQPGSYVIGAQVPLTATEDPAQVPFGRRVLLRLYDMVATAHQAARDAVDEPGLLPFTDRVGQGVSRNLCRGLAGLGGTAADQPFDVRFTWASSRPPGAATPPIRFDESMTTILAEAADDLGQSRTAERATVTGTITRTEGGNPSDARWIVVRGIAEVGNQVRRRYVWVMLPPETFTQALQAHDHGATVRLEGTLVRTGQRTELEDVRNFAIVS